MVETRGAKRKEPRSDIRIKRVRLNPELPLGPQLKPIRTMLNVSLRVMAVRLTGEDKPGTLSNWNHFENNTGSYKSDSSITFRAAVRYAKALNIQTIEFKISD